MVDHKILNKINPRVHPLLSTHIQSLILVDTSGSGKVLERKAVRLLTYNLFERPFVKNNDNDWKDERLDEFAQRLDEYDIICN